jgi:hypothetical protein
LSLLAALVLALGMVTPDRVSAMPQPGPVTPEEALRITAGLARRSPPLPAEIASLLRAREGRRPPHELLRRFHDALARYRAQGARYRAQGGEGDHRHHWDKNGLGCYAQGFDESGKLAHRNEHDTNGNGRLDPWELNPNRNETCREVVLFAYDQQNKDRGSFTLEFRTETDPVTGKTFSRTAGRWNYVVEDAHHHECRPTMSEWKAGMRYVKRATTALSKYVNNPLLAWQDGFRPYPVPATKTFHWFNSARWDDGRTLDPNHVEMFVAAMTDEGWRPVNISPIYHYTGKGDPVRFDPNKDAKARRNAGAGCLIEWHRHLEGTAGAEGAATGNTEGRDWMGHLWIYGGLYPFGDRDIDCSEPHGWFTPLNNVPALCNSVGTGI